MSNPFSNATVFKIDADPAEYHADDGAVIGHAAHIMSNGQAKALASCPAKFYAGVTSEDTDSTEWGTWLDTAVLAQAHMKERMAVKPETYPDTKTGDPKAFNANSTWCKTWLKDHADKIVLKREQLDEVGKAATRLLSDDRLFDLIKCSSKQVWIRGEYHDKATGLVVPVKALVDLVPDARDEKFGKCLADLKTCRSANPRQFSRQIFTCGYHLQAAWYLDLYTAATGEDRIEWRFVLSENVPPYQPGRRLLSEEYLALGRQQYRAALALYCRCLADDYWPAWDDGQNTLDGWTLSQPEPWMVMAGAENDFSRMESTDDWNKEPTTEGVTP